MLISHFLSFPRLPPSDPSPRLLRTDCPDFRQRRPPQESDRTARAAPARPETLHRARAPSQGAEAGRRSRRPAEGARWLAEAGQLFPSQIPPLRGRGTEMTPRRFLPCTGVVGRWPVGSLKRHCFSLLSSSLQSWNRGLSLSTRKVFSSQRGLD